MIAETSGWLSRVTRDGQSLTLRFHPFEASSTVLEVTCEHPTFAGDLNLGIECDVSVSTEQVDITDYFADKRHLIEAKEVRAIWVECDLQDHAERAAHLDKLNAALQIANRDLRQQIHRIAQLVNELLRRAEIKAASSDAHAQLQAPTIAALERLEKLIADSK